MLKQAPNLDKCKPRYPAYQLRGGLLIILVIVALTQGCTKSNDAVPVAIYPEEDVCETCRMLITDQRFAAECLMKKGRAKKFDDVICMIRYFDMAATLGIAKKDDVKSYFVKDYDTKEWCRNSH